jgi:F-type H+-transporting ATPase subunit alpha
VRPAINVGISVSRVGGNAQIGPMKKIAGRLKIDLSQYRDLEAFAQFGSDLDAATQQTLARGDRLVATLNQSERSPLPVQEQVVQIYAASNGFVDRITTDRVPEFLDALTQRFRSEQTDLLEKIAGGDWSDETQESLKTAVAEFADDFGYDLDEDGQPVASGDSERVARRDESSEEEAEQREEQAEEAAVA